MLAAKRNCVAAPSRLFKAQQGRLSSKSKVKNLTSQVATYKYRKGLQKFVGLRKKLCDEMFCFSSMHMQCSLLDPFWLASFIKGMLKQTCFDTCDYLDIMSNVSDKWPSILPCLLIIQLLLQKFAYPFLHDGRHMHMMPSPMVCSENFVIVW